MLASVVILYELTITDIHQAERETTVSRLHKPSPIVDRYSLVRFTGPEIMQFVWNHELFWWYHALSTSESHKTLMAAMGVLRRRPNSCRCGGEEHDADGMH